MQKFKEGLSTKGIFKKAAAQADEKKEEKKEPAKASSGIDELDALREKTEDKQK